MPKAKCTFNATVEELPAIEAPATPETHTPSMQRPPSPPPKRSAVPVVPPPELERQCAFAPHCNVEATDTLSTVELTVIISCIAMVSVAVYSMGYRHALENTLSNMMFEE